jgi:uncharacterized protein YutE (UPF0331/DUF86 family)
MHLVIKCDYVSRALVDLKEALSLYGQNGPHAKLFYYAAEKKAEEVVESAVGINQEILFQALNHVSGSYKESFSDLEKLALFPKNELTVLARTANFRNRLAHDYMHLSEKETIGLMKDILKLYPNYLKTILSWIKRQKI